MFYRQHHHRCPRDLSNMQSNYYSWRKLAGTLHLWLGMSSGLVIVILGITGCLYVFIDELRPIVYRDRIFIQAPQHSQGTPLQQQRVPLHVLRKTADAALGSKIPLLDAEVYPDKLHTVVFRYRERNNAANWYPNYFISYFRVYLNPFTGTVVKVENSKWEFFNLVVMLHCCLLLGHLGTQIITWSTIIFMLMLLSGIILWWPKNRAAAKKRFAFNWKKQTSWKRKNYDMHQIPGFYSFIIAFFIALTGLAMLLPKVDYAIKYVVSGGTFKGSKSGTQGHHTVGNNYADTSNPGVTDRALSQSLTLDPTALKYRIYPAKNHSDALKIKTFKAHSRHQPERLLSFNQHTAALLQNKAYSSLATEDKLDDLYYDIHVGALLSLPGKILAFMVSLITATLPVSGFLIWKARKKQKTLKNVASSPNQSLVLSS